MGKKCFSIFVLIAILWNINLSAVETNLLDVKKVEIGKAPTRRAKGGV